jgi:hypothetical protein
MPTGIAMPNTDQGVDCSDGFSPRYEDRLHVPDQPDELSMRRVGGQHVCVYLRGLGARRARSELIQRYRLHGVRVRLSNPLSR